LKRRATERKKKNKSITKSKENSRPLIVLKKVGKKKVQREKSKKKIPKLFAH